MPILKIFYDNESSTLPLWREPSEDPRQPHIVQLAAKVIDIETREVVSSMDRLVKPDGWKIDQGAYDVHGISMERADAEGLPEADVLHEFLELWKGITRVGHNEGFDARMIRIATKRYCEPDVQQLWKDGASECTAYLSKQVMMPGQKGFKKPSLADAYFFFTGKKLEGQHNAMVDVEACEAIYFAILDNQIGGLGAA